MIPPPATPPALAASAFTSTSKRQSRSRAGHSSSRPRTSSAPSFSPSGKSRIHRSPSPRWSCPARCARPGGWLPQRAGHRLQIAGFQACRAVFLQHRGFAADGQPDDGGLPLGPDAHLGFRGDHLHGQPLRILRRPRKGQRIGAGLQIPAPEEQAPGRRLVELPGVFPPAEYPPCRP